MCVCRERRTQWMGGEVGGGREREESMMGLEREREGEREAR
jgi:hypothetical protein